jgi:hypothetical protein
LGSITTSGVQADSRLTHSLGEGRVEGTKSRHCVKVTKSVKKKKKKKIFMSDFSP